MESASSRLSTAICERSVRPVSNGLPELPRWSNDSVPHYVLVPSGPLTARNSAVALWGDGWSSYAPLIPRTRSFTLRRAGGDSLSAFSCASLVELPASSRGLASLSSFAQPPWWRLSAATLPPRDGLRGPCSPAVSFVDCLWVPRPPPPITPLVEADLATGHCPMSCRNTPSAGAPHLPREVFWGPIIVNPTSGKPCPMSASPPCSPPAPRPALPSASPSSLRRFPALERVSVWSPAVRLPPSRLSPPSDALHSAVDCGPAACVPLHPLSPPPSLALYPAIGITPTPLLHLEFSPTLRRALPCR